MDVEEHANMIRYMLDMQNDETTATMEELTSKIKTGNVAETDLDENAKEQVEKMRPVDVTVEDEQRREAAEQYELLRRVQNEREWNEILADDKHGDEELFLKSSAFCRLSPAAATQLV